MKYMLMSVVILAAMSGAAYSQRTSQSADQRVHPGTAILDRMGIFAGYSVPAEKTRQANTESMPITQVSEPATKQ